MYGKNSSTALLWTERAADLCAGDCRDHVDFHTHSSHHQQEVRRGVKEWDDSFKAPYYSHNLVACIICFELACFPARII